jgi:undecaprenyl diphosphate synthase
MGTPSNVGKLPAHAKRQIACRRSVSESRSVRTAMPARAGSIGPQGRNGRTERFTENAAVVRWPPSHRGPGSAESARRGCANCFGTGPVEDDLSRQRLPRHIGFIPDGNRRWAVEHGLPKQAGYAHGVAPGLALFDACKRLGIEEVSVYGYTQDNTRRPAVQKDGFRAACTEFALEIARQGAALLVLGDETSGQFPAELKPFRSRRGEGIKVNFLVNYGWEWDLDGLRSGALRSHQVSRLDLIVRWGGGRRLSGFLPAQSVYADIYVVDDYWPDFQPTHIDSALAWFAQQDRTIGG